MAGYGYLIIQDKWAVADFLGDIEPKTVYVPILKMESSPNGFLIGDISEKNYFYSWLSEWLNPIEDYLTPVTTNTLYSALVPRGDGGAAGLSWNFTQYPSGSKRANIFIQYADDSTGSAYVTNDGYERPFDSKPFIVEYQGNYYPFLIYSYMNYKDFLKIELDLTKQTKPLLVVNDPNAPLNPEYIKTIEIEPISPYIGKGNSETFSAYYTYWSGERTLAKDIEWRIDPKGDRNYDDLVSEYGGVTISSSGVLTTGSNTVVDRVNVVAYSKTLKYGSSTTAFIVLDYTPGTEVPPGGVPNSGNQYFPGGVASPSVRPQGSYDNTFGPNASGLVPGLDSTGQSTGQGGAVGNDISLSGMYTKYLMNQEYLNTLAQFFWEDNVGIQALKLAFGNPIDSIISLISYPFNLDLRVPTVQQNIFFGKYDSQFPGRAISRSSFQIDWGTIPIDFYWGNFLDYAPYTQVQLYLPWGVGFVSIDPNEVMPYSNVPNDFNPVNYNKGSIRVVTNIELDKGACVHNVIGNRGLVIGSYGGVVGKQIPMTALDQSAKMLALLGAASGVGMAAGNAMAGAATGKYTSAIPKYSTVGYGNNNWVQSLGFEHKFEGGQMLSDMGGSKAMKAGLASAAALASTPPNYPRAGTFSDATNTMCAQVPYIIISRPSQSVPQNYGHYNGYPSNIYYNKLSMVSGYTEISEIHLDNVPGSVEELEELDSMLKGGVLL